MERNLTIKKFNTVIKESLSYENILSSFIAAVGYGVGYSLPSKLEMHPIICIIFCLLLGSLFDILASYILKKKHLINTRKRKIAFAAIIYSSYVFAWLIIYLTLNYDIDNDLILNIAFILGFQILSYLFTKIKRIIKNKNNNKRK